MDKKKLIGFLESRIAHNREIGSNKGFEDYCEGERKEAIMIVSMIKDGAFDLEGDE